MQVLKCLLRGHYLGSYISSNANSLDLELYCARCKGHTIFRVRDGDLSVAAFVLGSARSEDVFGDTLTDLLEHPDLKPDDKPQ